MCSGSRVPKVSLGTGMSKARGAKGDRNHRGGAEGELNHGVMPNVSLGTGVQKATQILHVARHGVPKVS
ncbi:hypothetical protein Pyn_11367 [Prunus yedoensis var. nudiflora]|uniref:Uncharacterized protein n=1 Tax=Prunus yedoensis var. nudiflora TaxID=2094558 RepID=A0A314YRA3_PRUYE|nr:hypothetical protein Pyn_11367 [Prunus yedoensis var. nudiflora]